MYCIEHLGRNNISMNTGDLTWPQVMVRQHQLSIGQPLLAVDSQLVDILFGPGGLDPEHDGFFLGVAKLFQKDGNDSFWEQGRLVPRQEWLLAKSPPTKRRHRTLSLVSGLGPRQRAIRVTYPAKSKKRKKKDES